MAPEAGTLIRPRTAGEVLDDAWRLCQADAAPLLALTGLFHVPFVVALLVLVVGGPYSTGWGLLLAGLTSGLLLVTGLGSGACQALFLRRAAEQEASLGECLRAGLRRAPSHLAGRALLLVPLLLWTALFAWPGLYLAGKSTGAHAGVGVLIVAGCMFLPAWILGALGGSLHTILAAGEGGFFAGIAATLRDLERQAGKALAVSLARTFFFVFAFLNLLVLVNALLTWTGDLGGVDLGVWSFQLGLGNPVYVLSLLLLTWLLLIPYAEATRYLLYVDGRARYEGLDLWYRIRRLFTVSATGRASLLLLAMGGVLAFCGKVGASEADWKVVQQVRAEVQRLHDAEPYPGGDNCERQLLRLARRLDPTGSATHGPYRWFYRTADGFHAYPPEQGRRLLGELDASLGMAEEELARPNPRPNRERIKGLTPPGEDEGAASTPVEKTEVKRPIKKEEEDEEPESGSGRQGGVVHADLPVGGLGTVAWLLLAGLLLAIVAAAGVLFWKNRTPRTPAPKEVRQGAREPALDELVAGPDARTPAALWRQADGLAQQGRYLEALRMLYAAVLGLLHGANLIRFERMRTNGEYLRQLRSNAEEDVPLPDRFRNLTRSFEVKWYGERDCGASEYAACRELAEEIRELVR